jgi:hypothetical protein
VPGRPARTARELTERQILIREVTNFQPTWTQQERGGAGAFTVQLILDHDAAEYVIRPTAEDALVLMPLLAAAAKVFFDTERRVLVFGARAVAG